MSTIILEGGVPLQGEIEVKGSVNSALKLIIGSIFTNQEVTLRNIPKVKSIVGELRILQDLGGEYEWVGENTLKINNSKLDKSQISPLLGKNLMTAYLFAGPLLYRFGEAAIPLPDAGIDSLAKFSQTWSSLGIEINFDKEFIYLRSDNSRPGRIEFESVSQTATDNAILSSVFISGETTIINISEEIEVQDLVKFLNLMGAEISYENKKVLKIKGVSRFQSTDFSCVSDSSEVVFYSVASIITKGNILIKNIEKNNLNSFISLMNKLDIDFEISSENELRVWNKGKNIEAFDIQIATFPNLVTSFTPFLTILGLQSNGLSRIKDLSYKDKFDYVYTLKKMMAKIKIFESGKDLEPCELQISGPSKLTTLQVEIPSSKQALTILLACSTIENRVQIVNAEYLDYYYENVIDNFIQLGSKITL